MRRAWPVQLLAVGTVAGSASMLLLTGAHAAGPATSAPGVLAAAWFWQNAYEQASPPVAEAPPTTEPTGVPSGDLAVAYTQPGGASSSKQSALSFDIGSLPGGTSVTSFTFTLTLDSANPAATTFDQQGATVVACQPTRGWPAKLGADYTDAPSVDCSAAVKPKIDGDSYTFSIPAIAQSWVDDQNLGVAIVADPKNSAAPFQLVFKGAKDVKAQMTAAPPVSQSTATGGGATSTGSLATSSVPSAPMPPASTTTTTVPTGVTVPPAPVVASPPAAVVPAARPVAAVKPAPTAPTALFWLAALALGVLVLAASLVLGDGAPVAVATGAGTRLERVLRQRQDVLTARSL